MSKLVCSLGTSWTVIPEIAGYVWPDIIPLYSNSHIPLKKLKYTPDGLYVITTGGNDTQEPIQKLRCWWNELKNPLPLKIFRACSSDSNQQEEVELIRELIFRTVLDAGPQCIISLAGGRKTMSADLQYAGLIFGCSDLLHVIIKNEKELKTSPLSGSDPKALTVPLSPEWASLIDIVHVGSSSPLDILDLDPPLTANKYPLPDPETFFNNPGSENWLWKELEKRKQESSQLFANFYSEVVRQEIHENWRFLYRLSPVFIRFMQKEFLSELWRGWLEKIPKAELHCHFGGFLSLEEQIEVAKETLELHPLLKDDFEQAQRDVQKWIETFELPVDPDRRQNTSLYLLSYQDPEWLEEKLYGESNPRVALIYRHPKKFSAFEQPGVLMGSSWLARPDALPAIVRKILERCQRENIVYLELRCSPYKYFRGDILKFIQLFDEEYLKNALKKYIKLKIIFIVDRRHNNVGEVVQKAIKVRQKFPDFVVGLDVAGDESFGDPQSLALDFLPAFEECLSLTIHAGEGQSAEKIWGAAYHLHADRIGHGLTLEQKPELAKKFRNRQIALELCPTSNIEVVGYQDPQNPHTKNCERYPFRELWNQGLALTINTDNPGISRTNLVNEYLKLARMDGNLTLWETLTLIKQSFLYGFMDSKEKEFLLKDVDAKIFEICKSIKT